MPRRDHPVAARTLSALTLACFLPSSALASTAPRFDAEAHGRQREEVQKSARSDGESGDFETAGRKLEEAAAESGDPVLFLDAADAYLAAARASKDTDLVERSREPARIALDVLKFMAAGDADPTWKISAPYPVAALVDRADRHLEAADELARDLERGEDEPVAAATDGDEGKKKRKKRERGPAKPGTGMLASGGVLTALGVGALGLMSAGIAIGRNTQRDVEDLGPVTPDDPAYQDLDKKGKNANLMAYVGGALAGALVAAGVTLLVLGKRKRSSGGSQTAGVMFVPTGAGMALTGRF